MQAASPSPSLVQFALADEAATARLGAALARAIEAQADAIRQHGLVIGLSGELGSGKTALVRAVLRRLGVSGPVRSPTFALLELYSVSSLNFYHFDLYRFSKPEEFSDLGFQDFVGPGAVCAIEWPERAGSDGISVDLHIRLQIVEAGRVAQIDALSAAGRVCLQEVEREWQTDQDGAC